MSLLILPNNSVCLNAQSYQDFDKFYFFEMNWVKLENIIGEKVPGCVKKVLDVCGYDTFMSISGIKDDSIS